MSFHEVRARLFRLKEPEKSLPRKWSPSRIFDDLGQSFREELGAKRFVAQTRIVLGGSGRHRPERRAVNKTIRSFFLSEDH